MYENNLAQSDNEKMENDNDDEYESDFVCTCNSSVVNIFLNFCVFF